MIPAGSKSCPECGVGQDVVDPSGGFSFETPSEVGLDENIDGYQNYFMDGSSSQKKKDSCPVCGSRMSYKDKVASWYCPKCKSFY